MSVKLCQNFVKPIFRGILKSRNPGVRNAREPDALSGRFACARLGETRKRKMDSHFRDCPSWRRYFVTYGAADMGFLSRFVACQKPHKIGVYSIFIVPSLSVFFRDIFLILSQNLSTMLLSSQFENIKFLTCDAHFYRTVFRVYYKSNLIAVPQKTSYSKLFNLYIICNHVITISTQLKNIQVESICICLYLFVSICLYFYQGHPL